MTLYQRHVFGGSTAGPRLLILAGIHGDECEPMNAVVKLRDELATVDIAGQVTLVPVANPSAYQHVARVGEDQLDLARTFPGNPGGTLTERLAAQLTKEIASVDFLMDLHTGGKQLDILPMTGFMLHPQTEVLALQRQMAMAFGLPYVWGTSADVDGRSLSAARDAEIPAIYAEFGGGGRFRNEIVTQYVTGCKNVMTSLGMLAGEPCRASSKFYCDDPQSGSGHLQICQPAPADGIFIAEVRLGDVVRAGQTIGRIVDLMSGEDQMVMADRDGIVLALYAQAQIVRGTVTCVIVNFQPFAES